MQEQLVTQTDIRELEHAEAKIERAMKNAFYDVGCELRHINERRLYILRAPTFEDYCQKRWEISRPRAYQLIEASTIVDSLSTTGMLVDNLPARETHVRPLSSLEDDAQRVEVWQRVVERANGNSITARLVSEEVARYQAALNKAWITLGEWNEGQRPATTDSSATFNRTDDTSIEWAAWTWNPVTGCEHGCPYCYARDIAKRFYPQEYGFTPTYHPNRLAAPLNTKPIAPRFEGDQGHNGVFVCSMADLFGEWVPDDWIRAVMDVVAATPQWTYIFLTKNPKRLIGVQWPPNAWVGTTVDEQARARPAEYAFRQIEAKVKFLSCEPMRERLVFQSLAMFNWVIIGAQSRSTGAPELQPQFEWVWALTNQAHDAGCKVFWKPNLTARPREYPTT